MMSDKERQLNSLTSCEDDINILSEILDYTSSTEDGYDIDTLMNDELMMDNDLNSVYSPKSDLSAEQDQQPVVPGTPAFIASRSNASGKLKSSLTSESEDRKTQHVVVVAAPKAHPCMSRNAVAARENRQKKKHYITTLERDNKQLKEENTELKCKVENQEKSLSRLSEQVAYLQSVLANQSTLSALLSNIQNTSGVNFKSSWCAKQKNVEVKQEASFSHNSFIGENQENDRKAALRRSKRKCVFEKTNSENPCKRSSNKTESESGDRSNYEQVGISPCLENATESFSDDSNVSRSQQQGGVCLHVSGEDVSLEFCACCSKMAAVNRVLDDHSYVRCTIDV